MGRVQPEVRAGGPRGDHAARCFRQDRRCFSAARTAGRRALRRQAVAAAIRPKESDPAGGVTFADWQASERLLATSLNARLVTKTNSGHNIYAYAPQLVIDAIREVVDAVRGGEASAAIDADARAALDKALDESFAGSGLPGAAVALWIPGKGSWVATRGVADLRPAAR